MALMDEAEKQRRLTIPSIHDDVDVPCLMCLKPHKAPALNHSSLFVFSGENRLRIFVHNVVRHRAFEIFIIAVIFANSIYLVFDDPTVADSDKPAYQFWIDVSFAIVYTVEMLLKIVAFGFALHSHAYLRDRWNVLDCAIVLLTWLSFVPGVGNYSALRVLRVLRPLRSMNAVKGLKVRVTALLHSFGGLIPVLLLAGLVMAIFAIVDVQVFGGLFRNECVAYVPTVASNGSTGVDAIRHPAGYRCDPDATAFDGNLGTRARLAMYASKDRIRLTVTRTLTMCWPRYLWCFRSSRLKGGRSRCALRRKRTARLRFCTFSAWCYLGRT